MTRTSHRDLKHERSRRLLEEASEGTAARTRPLSFEDIMLRRKRKKASADVKNGSGEAENISGKYTVENVKDSGRHKTNIDCEDANPCDVKNGPANVQKGGSRKKEARISRREEDRDKSKRQGINDSDRKSKHKLEKDRSHKNDRGSRSHGRSTLDEQTRDRSGHDFEKKHHRDPVDNGRYMDRDRGTSERESRARGTSERENKRKDRNEDAEKYRERHSSKKQDSERKLNSEIVGRREKMSYLHSHHEEGRKRRRSRSLEQAKDSDKRSNSSSPRPHRYMSSHGQEHADLSSISKKDRSGRNFSDAERNRIPSNGSSSHYRRHGVSSSGIGGYSPRKRKTEAAVKTPSPPMRSPERKSSIWDLSPAAVDNTPMGLSLSGPLVLHQTKTSSVVESGGSVAVTSNVAMPFSGLASNNLSAFSNASIDSIQLTQATRPMRRLYIDNVPGSVSEKDVMECFNSFLLSSGSNHIQGTRPCISCMIHKEKGQALVEFLTPQDASTALALDGKTFFGCSLKIRRPKDFTEVTSGKAEKVEKPKAVDKSRVEALPVSDFVEDSSHKIFVGGFSETISSEMFMEIASVFGPLKSYHFEVNADLHGHCVFLEYADQSVTLKACAGLNGMKLGGKVITVAQAVPDASSRDDTKRSTSYVIPEHAKPLLERPTRVLKIKNVLDPEAIGSLLDSELEEILDDVRLECARFGSVKSVNVVKIIAKPQEITENRKSNTPAGTAMQENSVVESVEGINPEARSSSMLRSPGTAIQRPADEHESGLSDPAQPAEVVSLADHGHKYEDGAIESGVVRHSVAESMGGASETNLTFQESKSPKDAIDAPSEQFEEVDNSQNSSNDSALKLDKASRKSRGGVEMGATENGEGEGVSDDGRESFEVGSILVEFRRAEASCMAAHCLHGRLFDERVVSVEYIPYSLFQARFSKEVSS